MYRLIGVNTNFIYDFKYLIHANLKLYLTELSIGFHFMSLLDNQQFSSLNVKPIQFINE
jgi:hypothetical protein